MSLEEYIPDIEDSEQWGNQAEKISEVSEKVKKAAKKSQAWIKKVQKDEQKAKKQDLLLAWFLVKILLDKKYDPLLKDLFKLIDDAVASNFIIWIMSLVYLDISDEIRNFSKKPKINFDYINTEIVEFDDNNLNPQIKERINLWIEDINDILQIEYSSILTQRLIKQLKTNENIIYFIAKVFMFFLENINIKINKDKALNISNFITNEILKNLWKLKLEKI